jgi:uncharacterized protein YjbJ (UPF0337 family)
MREFNNMSDALWNQIKGNWKQFKGEVKKQWGDLTDDELDQIEGDRDKLIGLIQERYGEAQHEVERQVDEWLSRRRDRNMS